MSTTTTSTSNNNVKIRISTDGGQTWKEYVEGNIATSPAPSTTTTTTTTTRTSPPPSTGGVGGEVTTFIMHANWLTNADFDQIAKGNLTSKDSVRYRCTKYPDKYDQVRVDHLKNNYRAKIPGLKLGIDIGFSDIIVANAAKFKSLGFDYVEYNLEAAFDGPNSDSEARNNVEKIRRAAGAVRAQGMRFSVAPGRPNSSSFMRTGLLDDVAKLVDHYHIQAQSIRDTSDREYADFTESVTRQLRAANPKIVVTSQVAVAQGAQTGKAVQQTMRDVIIAAMNRPPPGNTQGVGLWITSGAVQEAKAFHTWFRQKYPAQ
jgi:hypothetical protein